MIFAYFDGDDIGPALELLLLDDLIEEARKYSGSISNAFEAVCRSLASRAEVDIIVAGGDDLVASWPDASIELADVHELRRIFFRNCGRTMSVGVGYSAAEAVANLRRAKLTGKDKVVAPAMISS
jgi:CRISPR/Cas system-associated protein Cas10 (large subunit of type III CRISPR-Cas system)